jgi:O-succinylbenzoate synthase
MRIDRVDVFHLALPLREPQKTKAGEFDKLGTVLVQIHSGDATGWGEASPGSAPVLGPECATGVFSCVKDWLAPRLVGCQVDSGDDLQERLAVFHGNPYAKSALDTAWWDLKAKIAGQPLHQTLGGKRENIEVGVSFDQMDNIDDFLAGIGRAFEAGFCRVELKMRPGWDVQMLNAVRHEYPTQTIHTDVETGLTLNHMEILYRLDDFALAMVEQPLPADDLVGHAMVQEAIRTPVCLDEAIATTPQAEMALELKSCQYVNVKPGRVGGLTAAMAIHDICHEGCVPCYLGGVPQSAVGTILSYALASKENFSYPADYITPESSLAVHLGEMPSPTCDEEGKACVHVSKGPGIGMEPDPKDLKRFTVASATVQ